MNHRDAQANFTPTLMPGVGDAINVVSITREPLSGEREYIKAKIRAKESEIGRLGQEIRWLRMELETA